MLALIWLTGLLRRRTARLAATAAGVALAVALLASIATFLAGALATMTIAASHRVVVDWQVEVHPGVNPSTVLAATRANPDVRVAAPMTFAAVTGLEARTGTTVQSTGAGVVVGVPDGYTALFPGQVRMLVGDPGVLLAQQTAANLHAGPGDTVSIGRAGLPSVAVRVDGVVDLPQADSLFQTPGAAAGTLPSAPPDNVLILPAVRWHQAFDPLAVARPDQVRNEVHAGLVRHLPRDPGAAFNRVSGAARHLEAVLAGGVSVGDNLGAALGAARSDALYAQILFLLLGLPGAALAGLLTGSLAGGAAGGRRRDLALLRVRGASSRTMIGTSLVEAATVATAGSAVGLGVAALVGRAEFGSATFGATSGAAVIWAGGAALCGVTIAVVSLVVPTLRDARRLTVATSRQQVGPRRRSWWLRIGLDVWLLAAAGLVFWLTSRAGYQVVLVPEGLPTLSVNYWALSGPLLFWAGSGLLAWRLADALFGRGRRVVAGMARPVARGLAATIAASLARHRYRLARPVALVVLTVAFATSTAVFNATYHTQAGVDARLTNGADVTVTYPPSRPAPPATAATLAGVSGIRHVEPLLHRFAYVGADLQDLFGVRANTVASTAQLQDAFFVGGTARALMARLAAQPDGILVSAETARDFRLNPGDQLRLRVRDARTGQLVPVAFRFVGLVKEFPTAPRDSFLVANAGYVANQTGNRGTDAFLLTTSTSPVTAGTRVRALVGSAASVTDLTTSERVIGSALTAVNLNGLTRVELAFALVLAAAVSGLLLAQSLAERRRSLAIARALGARPRQVASFVRVEAALVTGAGLLLGVPAGWGLSELLVKILTGVFDPPPASLSVPWGYLVTVGILAVGAAATAGEIVVRASRAPIVETIRDL